MNSTFSRILPTGLDHVRSIYMSSAIFCFTNSIMLNSFLVWLIRNKTPGPMRSYSKLLLFPCAMDLLITSVTLLVQPIPIVDHGYHAVIQNGFFRHSPQPYTYIANVLWFQLLLLFLTNTCIQFVFRYYMIFSDGKIPAKLKWSTIGSIALLLVAHVCLHIWSDYPYAEYGEAMAKLEKLLYEEVGLTDVNFSSFTHARSYPWMFHCAVMVVLFSICYAVVGSCAMKTRHYFANLYGNDSDTSGTADKAKQDKMREYQNQITEALIVQAVLPTVEVLELSLQVLLPVFFPGKTIHYMVYCAIPLYFMPVLNPICTMLLVKPYRHALFKVLRLKRRSSRRVGNGAITTVTSKFDS